MLDGSWSSKTCGATPRHIELVIAREALTRSEYFYRATDTTCATAYAVAKPRSTLRLGFTAPAAPSAREIDVVSVSTTLTVLDDVAADHYNAISYCGITGWGRNFPRDVTGKTCVDEGTFTWWAAGHVSYDIYQATIERLYFGDPSTGTGDSSDTRPTQLSSRYFTRD